METQQPTSSAEAMTLKRFKARSEAFIFAAERTDPHSLVYLEQGTAEALRHRARTELMCPEPGCTSPALTTVHRAPNGRRDGYKHHRVPLDGRHSDESVMHRQAKALICRWASTLPSVATAHMEVPVAGGERVADVLLTSHSGNRLAVEIQYSNETVEHLAERTASYEAAGVAVTWLFGSVGDLSPLKRSIRSVHQQILDRNAPVMWVNPVEETIGWLAHATETRPATSDDSGVCEVRFCGLDGLALRGTGLFPHDYLAIRRAWEEAEAEWKAAKKATEQQIRGIVDRLARARTPARAPATTRTANTRPRCRRCGLPLDPILKEAGVHFGNCADAHW